MELLPRPFEEQFDISIAYDGTWMHAGAPMGRMPLVRLFASVLHRDAAGEYWLVTPAERGRIAVEDAPFVATAYRYDTNVRQLYLTDNIGREWAVDAARPLALRVPPAPAAGPATGGVKVPYLQLGPGGEARVATAVYYALIDLALEAGAPDAEGVLWLVSGGVRHAVGCA